MRIIVFVAVSLLLAACGGGGGGGSSSGGGGTGGGGTSGPSFAGLPALQPGQPIPDGSYTADGTAVQAMYDANRNHGAYSGPADASIARTVDANGDRSDRVRYTTRGQTVEIDRAGATRRGYINGQLVELRDADAAHVEVADHNLEFVTYGGWGQRTGPNAEIASGDTQNFGAFGAPTPAATMPTGSATYTGRSIAILSNDGTGFRAPGGTRIMTSDVTITTPDFKSVTFSSDNTRSEILTGGRPGTVVGNNSNYDFTANGTITGNGFTATGGSSGGYEVNGTFYGGAAEEVGGTFTGELVGNQRIGGAFGARR